ncbi:MAG: TolC family protein [Nibricoccus sp.]
MWCAIAATSFATKDSTTPPPAVKLNLLQAIQLALKNNRSIHVDSYSPQIARAEVLESKGVFDPTLSFSRGRSDEDFPTPGDPLSYQSTRVDDYSLGLNGLLPTGTSYRLAGTANNTRGTSNGFADIYTSHAGISVTQPLLRGFGFSSNLIEVRVAAAGLKISEWNFRQTIIDTVTQVTLAYSDLLLAHEQLVIARRSQELAASLVDGNERRFAAGGISENQVIQARARAAAREETIVAADRNVRESDNRLRALLGESSFPGDGPLLGIESISEPPTLPASMMDAAESLRKALASRPDYQAAQANLTREQLRDGYARSQLMPSIDVVLNYGYNGLDSNFDRSRRMVEDSDYRGYSAGVVVTMPLTFTRERGRARIARLSREQAEADLGRLKQEIALAVANARGRIDAAQRRVEANQRAVDLANRALDDEIKKLHAGASTTFVVLQLQENLTQVASSLHRSKADQRVAEALYERELGVTLERNGIRATAGDRTTENAAYRAKGHLPQQVSSRQPSNFSSVETR